MFIKRRPGWLLLGWAVLLSLTACSSAYRFQYRYTMVEPPGGSEGVEDERVRIRLAPASKRGLLNLALHNKGTQTLALDWGQTYFIDPHGRRQQATEVGVNWFLKPTNWVSDRVAVAPGQVYRMQVQAGPHQSYNPFSINRQASGAVDLSSAPRSLFPKAGASSEVGEVYRGRTFQFILGLRIGGEDIRYPFTFRITDVEARQTKSK